jgi:hypothetical protein
VSVEIVLKQRQKVVAIPLNLLRSEGNSQYVWVRDPAGKAQKRAVTVGVETLESAEIRSGLKVGEQLVVSLPDGQTLVPGMTLATPAGKAKAKP